MSSRASRSFFNFSLIARSLSTHATASFAACSGRDLFFSRSVGSHIVQTHTVSTLFMQPTTRTIPAKKKPLQHNVGQSRGAEG